MDASHDELVSQFCGITGAVPGTAQTALASTNWNLEEAVTVFYASQDQAAESSGDEEQDEDYPPQAIPVASHAPAPSAAATTATGPTSSSRQTQPRASNMRTIRDLQNPNDSGSDSESDHEQDFFAGGEKSGLAVQNPNRGGGAGPSSDPFNDILNQARRNAERPEADDGPPQQPPGRSSAFTGRAQTLGGDDAPSQVVEDPNAPAAGRSGAAASSLPRIERILHLWQDGFSIDDGPLHRFDDPANASTLALINQGRAPLALLGVQPGQEVDLKLDTHKNENYVAPKKTYKPFGGEGQRLGSPTPGSASIGAAPSAAVATPPTTSASSMASMGASSVDIDPSAPTVTLQVRLGDGTRLQSRFNTTHTVGDVYDFVQRANPASATRGYALMTIMPNKDLSDKAAALSDVAELKRGGVVVQRWT